MKPPLSEPEKGGNVNDYAFDVYAMACVHVSATSEAEARAILRSDMQGIDGGGLVLAEGVTLSEISYRKVAQLVYATGGDGVDISVSTAPGDGPVEELEEDRCVNEGCRNSLDDGEGYDGYCGKCADRLEAQGHWAV